MSIKNVVYPNMYIYIKNARVPLCLCIMCAIKKYTEKFLKDQIKMK